MVRSAMPRVIKTRNADTELTLWRGTLQLHDLRVVFIVASGQSNWESTRKTA
jgi:hypothetical protein